MTEKDLYSELDQGRPFDDDCCTNEGCTSSVTIDRRTVLSTGAVALSLPLVGQVAADKITNNAYEPLGRLGLSDAREVVVDDAGEVAYVAGGTHVIAVDVSDPTNPTTLSQLRIATDHSSGPLGDIQDAKVDGDRLIAAGPPGYASQFGGFGVVDISDPSGMRELAFVETSPDHGIHNCYLDGEYAYLTGTNTPAGGQGKLRVYDIASGQPEEIGTWYPGDHDNGWNDVPAILRNLHDVYVQGETAYLSYWDAGVFLVDVSNPAAPEHINRIGDHTMSELQEMDRSNINQELLGSPGNAHYATVNEDGTMLGEGGESWASSPGDDSGPSPITLYDISDPTSPEELATIETEETGDNTQNGYWSTSHNFEIRGNKLYSSWYHAGVKIHDISDPENPEQIAWYADPDSKAFWTAQVGNPDEFFVATTWSSVTNSSDSALYTFPDEPGEMTEPPQFPPLEDDTADVTTTAAPNDGTTTVASGGESTTVEPTTEATRTPEGTESTTGSGTTQGEDSNDGGSPGLGILTAIAGIGIGVWRHRRRNRG